MTGLAITANLIKENYWPLVKSRQTLLLTLTGIAGYLCRMSVPLDWVRVSGLVASLLLTISGCTVFNMLLDRDIDRKMIRTRERPLASGRVNPEAALLLGSVLVAMGLVVAAILSGLYFCIILVGVGINVLVYTLWLKRRSAWSILWGGLAGGMPILAGSVLACGGVDTLGILLAAIIVCWIPSHNLTLSTLYSEDYLDAGVPTIMSSYGQMAVNFLVTISSVLVGILVIFVGNVLGFSGLVSAFLITTSIGLVSLSVLTWISTSPKLTAFMYKYSSLYMLVTMLVLSFSGLAG
jgi:heme o synthase